VCRTPAIVPEKIIKEDLQIVPPLDKVSAESRQNGQME